MKEFGAPKLEKPGAPVDCLLPPPRDLTEMRSLAAAIADKIIKRGKTEEGIKILFEPLQSAGQLNPPLVSKLGLCRSVLRRAPRPVRCHFSPRLVT